MRSISPNSSCVGIWQNAQRLLLLLRENLLLGECGEEMSFHKDYIRKFSPR